MLDIARKSDIGKLRYDLIPAYPLERLAEAYTIGAIKYADRNWEKGLTFGRVFSAMMRHAWGWWRGEMMDPLDRHHHLASVAWYAFALMEYEHRHTGTDDRPYVAQLPETRPLSEQAEVRTDKAGGIVRETVECTCGASRYPLGHRFHLPRCPCQS
jgi:Domain of unknown function (DUF5664)